MATPMLTANVNITLGVIRCFCVGADEGILRQSYRLLRLVRNRPLLDYESHSLVKRRGSVRTSSFGAFQMGLLRHFVSALETKREI